MWPRWVLAVDAMRFWSAKPPDSDRAAGGGLHGCPVGRPRATAGLVLAAGRGDRGTGRARREVVLEGGRRRGDGRDATAVPVPPGRLQPR